MEISVTDFSAPIGASVFKFCVHIKEDKVYCVNENKDANPHFSFFSFFQVFLQKQPHIAYQSHYYTHGTKYIGGI